MKRGIVIALAALLLAGCASLADPFPKGYPGGFSRPPEIGMAEADFLASMVPSMAPLYKVNTTRTQYGIHKQYVFGPPFEYRYIYFENGVLTAMQY